MEDRAIESTVDLCLRREQQRVRRIRARERGEPIRIGVARDDDQPRGIVSEREPATERSAPMIGIGGDPMGLDPT